MTLLTLLPVIIAAIGFLVLFVWAMKYSLGRIATNTSPSSDRSELVEDARAFLAPVVERLGFSEPRLQSVNYLVSEGQVGEVQVKIEGIGSRLNKDQFSLMQIVLHFPDEATATMATRALGEASIPIDLRKPPLMKKQARVWVPGSEWTGNEITDGLERIAEAASAGIA